MEQKINPTFLAWVGIFFLPLALSGQMGPREEADTFFIENPRPKALQFEFRHVFSTQVEMVHQENSTIFSQQVANERKRIRMEIPVLLKDSYQLVVGFRGGREEFEFSDLETAPFPFYKRLQENALNNIGIRVLFRRNISENKFWIARAGADLNGDLINLEAFHSFFKSNLLFIWGERKNPRTELGYGLSFSYDLGAPMVFPVFLYRKNFQKHWKLDLALPKEVKLQYAFSPSMYASTYLGISGASYHLSEGALEGEGALELRYSELKLSAKIEREIHDWLWVSAEAGGFRNLRLYLSEPGKRRKNSLVDSRRFFSGFVQFSVFVVPPKSLLNKIQ